MGSSNVSGIEHHNLLEIYQTKNIGTLLKDGPMLGAKAYAHAAQHHDALLCPNSCNDDNHRSAALH